MKMKILLFFASFLCFAFVCGNKNTNGANRAVETLGQEVSDSVYSLDELLAVADLMVDKTVKVKGKVIHTCKHSGRRCFIVGVNGDVSMRVEAKGNIGGFNRELIGSEIELTGVLKEHRLTKDDVDTKEKETLEKAKMEEGSSKSCQAELKNIESIKDWMKKNNKDYYATYYIDGLDYKNL